MPEVPSFIPCAEGDTTYRGIDGEDGIITARWLDQELDELVTELPQGDISKDFFAKYVQVDTVAT